MMKPRTRAALGGLLIPLALFVAACGGDDDDGAAAPATTVAPAMNSGGSGALRLTPTGDGCASVPTDGAGSFMGMAADPVATAASNNPALTTLVSAVKAAGLVDTLNSGGPFTVFAPIDSAFAAIPKADLDALLADKEALTKVLTFHVVPGELTAAQLATMTELDTVAGEKLPISASNGTITVNGGAKVVCADVPTANATVFLIDGVLTPGSATSMAQPTGPACMAVPKDGEGSFTGMADDVVATAASNNPELSTLVTAVKTAGLVDTLNSGGPFTVFAPVNSAFAAVPKASLDALLADKDALTDVLTYHVTSGKLTAKDLAGKQLTMVNGGTVTVEQAADGTLTVNGGPKVVCADIPTANATVFLIDGVLLPPS